MKRTLHPLSLAFMLAVLCGFQATVAEAQQSEAPRRPRGPVAGPSIPLPRGEGQTGEQSQRGEDAKGTTLRWEYCAVTHIIPRQTGLNPAPARAVVRHYPSNYEEIEGKDEEDALANALAKLGDDGWELVGIRQQLNITDGYGKSTHAYFFKRPK
jgi:hypothetical protein